ncbi:MAG: endolytic transglycosylase MltG [Geminicoccaceae bacterium]|nr:endolytic transglycosylase MltG [Geminicoccaceae bacterium]MCS7267114.1 endolytic transglycosylase MltG [Geminicoccaceae bacterium]MDW8124984.1 endolytic transglycosylase MltG [Geminicoccaceae bacterium]MDW8341714.1 endolytic transglycosylase MltG [Geminicoccaceae bacterium]
MRLVVRLVGALVSVALFFGVAGFLGLRWLERWLDAPGPLAEERILVVPRSGLGALSAFLEENGIVDRAWAFELAARLSGRERALKAGEYRFAAGTTPRAVLELLESGRVVLHRITIPEGLTTREVHALLEAAEVLEGPLPPPGRNGTLLPETWLVPRGELRIRVLERMQEAMRATLEELWAGRAPGLPYARPEEAVILASLVERETPKEEERPLVAAVFVNRLKLGMRLQSDPTVIFALTGGRNELGRPLSRKDLEIDHPFNTYRIAGLPPEPIANPGRGALAAALRPAEVDYLYFVADGRGGHLFARDLAEHNRNVARWRQMREAAERGDDG